MVPSRTSELESPVHFEPYLVGIRLQLQTFVSNKGGDMVPYLIHVSFQYPLSHEPAYHFLRVENHPTFRLHIKQSTDLRIRYTFLKTCRFQMKLCPRHQRETLVQNCLFVHLTTSRNQKLFGNSLVEQKTLEGSRLLVKWMKSIILNRLTSFTSACTSLRTVGKV